jgi:hypothetical protein
MLIPGVYFAVEYVESLELVFPKGEVTCIQGLGGWQIGFILSTLGSTKIMVKFSVEISASDHSTMYD